MDDSVADVIALACGHGPQAAIPLGADDLQAAADPLGSPVEGYRVELEAPSLDALPAVPIVTAHDIVARPAAGLPPGGESALQAGAGAGWSRAAVIEPPAAVADDVGIVGAAGYPTASVPSISPPAPGEATEPMDPVTSADSAWTGAQMLRSHLSDWKRILLNDEANLPWTDPGPRSFALPPLTDSVASMDSRVQGLVDAMASFSAANAAASPLPSSHSFTTMPILAAQQVA